MKRRPERPTLRAKMRPSGSSGSFFSSVSATLQAIAQRYGLETKLLEHRLQREWTAIIGEQVARHTRPDAIRFKKLYLIADNSVWLQQLLFLKPSLIEKINAAAGSPIVSDIVLRIGQVDSGGQNETSGSGNTGGTTLKEPDPRALAEAAEHAGAVTDPELRAHLTAVMAKALDGHRTPAKPPVP